MTFAAALANVNAAAAAALANASAVWDGGSVQAIFRAEEQSSSSGGVVGSRARSWLLEGPLADFGDTPPVRGGEISIDGVAYTVGQPDVDHSGWATFRLSKAA